MGPRRVPGSCRFVAGTAEGRFCRGVEVGRRGSDGLYGGISGALEADLARNRVMWPGFGGFVGIGDGRNGSWAVIRAAQSRPSVFSPPSQGETRSRRHA